MYGSFTQTPFNPAEDKDLEELVDMFAGMSRQTSPLSDAKGKWQRVNDAWTLDTEDIEIKRDKNSFLGETKCQRQ